jgi:hypothetical protein
VLNRARIQVHVEQASQNPPERLEIKQAHCVIERALLSTADQGKKATTQLKKDLNDWRELMFHLGVQRKAFTVYETVEALPTRSTGAIVQQASGMQQEWKPFIQALMSYCTQQGLTQYLPLLKKL